MAKVTMPKFWCRVNHRKGRESDFRAISDRWVRGDKITLKERQTAKDSCLER